jgi:hypothetical protein
VTQVRFYSYSDEVVSRDTATRTVLLARQIFLDESNAIGSKRRSQKLEESVITDGVSPRLASRRGTFRVVLSPQSSALMDIFFSSNVLAFPFSIAKIIKHL